MEHCPRLSLVQDNEQMAPFLSPPSSVLLLVKCVRTASSERISLDFHELNQSRGALGRDVISGTPTQDGVRMEARFAAGPSFITRVHPTEVLGPRGLCANLSANIIRRLPHPSPPRVLRDASFSSGLLSRPSPSLQFKVSPQLSSSAPPRRVFPSTSMPGLLE